MSSQKWECMRMPIRKCHVIKKMNVIKYVLDAERTGKRVNVTVHRGAEEFIGRKSTYVAKDMPACPEGGMHDGGGTDAGAGRQG